MLEGDKCYLKKKKKGRKSRAEPRGSGMWAEVAIISRMAKGDRLHMKFEREVTMKMSILVPVQKLDT